MLLWSAIAKLLDPSLAESAVRAYGVFPPKWDSVTVGWVSFTEALTGFWLLTGWRSRGAAFSFFLLTALFLGVGAIGWLNGLDQACGCFGNGWMSYLPPGWRVLRDLLLFFAGAWLYPQRLALDCSSGHGKMYQ